MARQNTAPKPPPAPAAPPRPVRIPRAASVTGSLDLSLPALLAALPTAAARSGVPVGPATDAIPGPPEPAGPAVQLVAAPPAPALAALLTTSVVWERYGLSGEELLLAVADGQLTVHRVLGRPRFDEAELTAVLGPARTVPVVPASTAGRHLAGEAA